MGLGEEKGKEIDPKAGDMLPCGDKIWEKLQLVTSKETLVEVEHVKAPRPAQRRMSKRCRALRSLSLTTMKRPTFGQRRCFVGRRIYGGSESRNFPAGKRGGVCSFAVRGQLPLLSGTMERL